MTREYAIEVIENLYPVDAEYSDTAEVWRTEPTEILIRYAQLCLNRENEFRRKRKFEAKCKGEGF